MKNKIINIFILFTQFIQADSYYYQNGQKVKLISYQRSTSRNHSTIDYYINSRGIVLGVNNRLIMKLEDNRTLEQYKNKFNLIVEKQLSKNLYLLKIKDKNVTIDIANRLTKEKDVLYAHPDFIREILHRRKYLKNK